MAQSQLKLKSQTILLRILLRIAVFICFPTFFLTFQAFTGSRAEALASESELPKPWRRTKSCSQHL